LFDAVDATSAGSNVLTFTQVSEVPLYERSVSSPPDAVFRSMKVMIVPMRRFDQKGASVSVIEPAKPVSDHSRVHRRMSRPSLWTTSSNQLPPLPRMRPNCASAAAPGGELASWAWVPPPRKRSLLTALYSLSVTRRHEAHSSASTGARSESMFCRLRQVVTTSRHVFGAPNDE
jgi:hypothetical protein